MARNIFLIGSTIPHLPALMISLITSMLNSIFVIMAMLCIRTHGNGRTHIALGTHANYLKVPGIIPMCMTAKGII